MACDASIRRNERSSRSRWRGWAGLWLMSLALFTSPILPVRADMFTPSAKDQIRLGDQAAAEVMRKYRVVYDDRSRAVEEVGSRLLDALSPKERGPWNYRFHLIESKEINAFALPGGNVFMFTGLYNRMKSEDELAGVMGHELTHVREQHWAKMAGAQAKRQAGLAVILGLTRAGSTWQNAVGVVDTLLTLRYSRKDEDQADVEGLEDMVAAGYNPEGMLDLFHTLQSASGGGGGPAFLADHPLTKQRIQRTQERIDRLGSRNFPREIPLRGADDRRSR
jgi:predicted Zn-dependent protease